MIYILLNYLDIKYLKRINEKFLSPMCVEVSENRWRKIIAREKDFELRRQGVAIILYVHAGNKYRRTDSRRIRDLG